MKTILLFLMISMFLVADSVKTDLTVTFYNLTLEEATKLEKLINSEFKDYKFSISISDGKEQVKSWYEQPYNLLPLN